MYRPVMTPLSGASPLGLSRYPGFAMGRAREERRRTRGVRAALIRGRDGASAVVRLPTAVATAQGVRRLGRRSARAEAVLAQHDRGLRAIRSQETHIRTTITGAVILQNLRDVVAEARAAVAPANWAPVWNPILASTDYTLAAAQTGFSVAAIPAARRSALFWTLPLTSGLISALGRETLRQPVGLGLNAKPFWRESAIALAVPIVVGAAAAYFVRPRRPVRYLSP